MTMADFYPWLDALWIPIFILMLHRHQKPWAAGFVVCNMIMMRMLIELMLWFGHPLGFFTLLDIDLITRGLLLYSGVSVLYLTLALYSPQSNGTMFMAMSISLFFIATILFSVIMVL